MPYIPGVGRGVPGITTPTPTMPSFPKRSKSSQSNPSSQEDTPKQKAAAAKQEAATRKSQQYRDSQDPNKTMDSRGNYVAKPTPSEQNYGRGLHRYGDEWDGQTPTTDWDK